MQVLGGSPQHTGSRDRPHETGILLDQGTSMLKTNIVGGFGSVLVCYPTELTGFLIGLSPLRTEAVRQLQKWEPG